MSEKYLIILSFSVISITIENDFTFYIYFIYENTFTFYFNESVFSIEFKINLDVEAIINL